MFLRIGQQGTLKAQGSRLMEAMGPPKGESAWSGTLRPAVQIRPPRLSLPGSC